MQEKVREEILKIVLRKTKVQKSHTLNSFYLHSESSGKCEEGTAVYEWPRI